MPQETSKLPARVILIAGPTASGKSELAALLGERLGAEIVGADSRQVYRGLDVGTAKPSAELRRRTRHHLIDTVDVDEPYDVSTWRRDALAAIADIEARGRRVIVCGGTGLYLRSLTRGLFAGPAADPVLRERLAAEERDRPGALHTGLVRIDPAAAARIHPNDMVRLVRAHEVYELTGRPLSAWHREHGLADRPFAALVLEPAVSREELWRRIEERSKAIAEAGIVEELAALRARYPSDLKPFDAIGYREAGKCLDGLLALELLAPAISKATRAYAKRQTVWLRGQLETGPVGGAAAALAAAESFFDRVAKRQGIG